MFGSCQQSVACLSAMKQCCLGLDLNIKRTRRQELLAQMDLVVPWAALVELITPYYPEGKNGRPPFALESSMATRSLSSTHCSFTAGC